MDPDPEGQKSVDPDPEGPKSVDADPNLNSDPLTEGLQIAKTLLT